jgi:hypothetical protein
MGAASWSGRTVESDWYVTLTFDLEIGVEQAWGLLREYLDLLEARFRCPLPALMVLEHKPSGLGKPGGGHHFHIVVKGPKVFWGGEVEILEDESTPSAFHCAHPRLDISAAGQIHSIRELTT